MPSWSGLRNIATKTARFPECGHSFGIYVILCVFLVRFEPNVTCFWFWSIHFYLLKSQLSQIFGIRILSWRKVKLNNFGRALLLFLHMRRVFHRKLCFIKNSHILQWWFGPHAGAFRMPLGFMVIDLQKVLMGANSLERTSDMTMSTVTATSSGTITGLCSFTFFHV